MRTLSSLLLVSAATITCGQPPASPPETLEDATLHDVQFLNADRGWAVGDRGVIWKTDDGGRQWQLIDSPVNCQLRSISFINDRIGWIVGGWYRPLSQRSNGVVLHTQDGGQRWTAMKSETLPKLNHVQFIDRRTGWAVGEASGLYPSGILVTDDGGRSWASLPVNTSTRWRGVAFADARSGLLLGKDGISGTIRGRRVVLRENSGLVGQHVRAAAIAGRGLAWLVGDQGLIRVSHDQGLNWQPAQGRLQPRVADKIDFRTIATVGPKCWLAGSPGSCVMHSADAGRTWSIAHTGSSVPIERLRFLDDQRGWAVGALGTILATRNGGQSWIRQRSGGNRVALMTIAEAIDDSILLPLAQLSADAGYLSAAAVVSSGAAGQPQQDARVRAAVVATGGSFADLHVPLVEERLVRMIRQHRPDVVVRGAVAARSAGEFDRLLLSSIQKAADSDQYVEHLDVLGLTPWQTRKVFHRSDSPGATSLGANPTRLATRLGRSFGDLSSRARQLIGVGDSSSDQAYELMMSHVPRRVGERDFFAGISPGDGPRRTVDRQASTNVALLTHSVQLERKITELLDRAARIDLPTPLPHGELASLTTGLSDRVGGDTLFTLAQRYREIGRYDLAKGTLLKFIERYPRHELAEAAVLWLVTFQTSVEAQHAFATTLPEIEEKSSQVELPGASRLPPELRDRMQVVSSTSSTKQGALAEVLRREKLDPFQTFDAVQQMSPGLMTEPDVRFLFAAAFRNDGQPDEASRLLKQVFTNQPQGRWRTQAGIERYASTPHPLTAGRIAVTRRAAKKPLLDGRLSDRIWKAATSIQLGDERGATTSVLLAYDDEYLYIAATCSAAGTPAAVDNQSQRQRDVDLDHHDHVRLNFDIDRDRATAFELAIDQRGWARDSCWGDAGWNPKWYIAHSSPVAASRWTLEAAMPLRELGLESMNLVDPWCLLIERRVPGNAPQLWPQGGGYGLLAFDRAAPPETTVDADVASSSSFEPLGLPNRNSRDYRKNPQVPPSLTR